MFTCIISDIRSGVAGRTTRISYSETTKRKHFVTRQDVRNITRPIKDFSRHRHAEDAISVDRIVTELMKEEDPSPILAYKQQGFKNSSYPSLPDESFLLIIMTEFQAKLFCEYASKILCIDATYRTNEYKFKLITLLVVDEYRKGTYGGGNNDYIYYTLNIYMYVHVP